MKKHQIILSHLATVSWNIMFGYGVLSVIYGYWYTHTGSGWNQLDVLIKLLGFSLTLISVSVTSLSIYTPSNINEPSLLSKYLSAPVVVVMMLFIAAEAIYYSRYPHEAVVTGAALMGLSGALHQMIPRFHERGWYNKSIQPTADAAAD